MRLDGFYFSRFNIFSVKDNVRCMRRKATGLEKTFVPCISKKKVTCPRYVKTYTLL